MTMRRGITGRRKGSDQDFRAGIGFARCAVKKCLRFPYPFKGCRLPCSDNLLPPSNDTSILQETHASRNGRKKKSRVMIQINKVALPHGNERACFHTPDFQYYFPLMGIIPGPTSTSIIVIVEACVSSIMTVLGIATILMTLGA